MKKNVFFLFCIGFVLMNSVSAFANSRTAKGISITEQLGISSGAALACGVDREQLKNYEMIASRIIANPIKTEKDEEKALEQYAKAKLKAFQEQKQKSLMNCDEVLSRFEKQEIFKSVVYRDGTIKMPNGKVVKPERPVKNIKKKVKKNKKNKKAS